MKIIKWLIRATARTIAFIFSVVICLAAIVLVIIPMMFMEQIEKVLRWANGRED